MFMLAAGVSPAAGNRLPVTRQLANSSLSCPFGHCVLFMLAAGVSPAAA